MFKEHCMLYFSCSSVSLSRMLAIPKDRWAGILVPLLFIVCRIPTPLSSTSQITLLCSLKNRMNNLLSLSLLLSPCQIAFFHERLYKHRRNVNFVGIEVFIHID